MLAILPVLTLAAFGSATPILTEEAQPPPISSSQGFILVANVTDLSKDLIPSVNHWILTAVHIGAAQSTAVLTNNTTTRVFFENGTADNIGIAADGGSFPWGLYIINYSPDPAKSDYVEWLGLEIGLAQKGVGIRDGAGAMPQLFAPESGTFVICTETNPVYGHPQFPVKFVKSQVVDGVTHQEIPELCAPITLLPQCAQLSPIADGAEYNHDYVRTVRCYDNLAAIKW